MNLPTSDVFRADRDPPLTEICLCGGAGPGVGVIAGSAGEAALERSSLEKMPDVSRPSFSATSSPSRWFTRRRWEVTSPPDAARETAVTHIQTGRQTDIYRQTNGHTNMQTDRQTSLTLVQL